MMKILRSDQRGFTDLGWLQARHSFSFGEYNNPEYVRFRNLRVMNNDTIQPSGGFATHSHQDMEILTYIIEGQLEHKDDMGNGSVIQAGDFQRMTAGTGVRHSEFNPSSSNTVRLYQIWILPDEKGLKPSYEQKSFNDLQSMDNGLTLVASKNDSKVLKIHQDVQIYLGRLRPETNLTYSMKSDRGIWLQMIRGNMIIGAMEVAEGDGIVIERLESIKLESFSASEFLLFDLK